MGRAVHRARTGVDPLRQRAVAADRRARSAARDARLGTNPFCVGIPRPGGEPIVLDFATSKIAQGKTRVAYNKGVAGRAGTLIDDQRRADDRSALSPSIEPLRRAAAVRRAQGRGTGPDLRAARRRARRRRHRPRRHRRPPARPQQHVFDPASTPSGSAPRPTWRARWKASSPTRPRRRRSPASSASRRRASRARDALRRLREGIPVDSVTWAEIVAAAPRSASTRSDVESLARGNSQGVARDVTDVLVIDVARRRRRCRRRRAAGLGALACAGRGGCAASSTSSACPPAFASSS